MVLSEVLRNLASEEIAEQRLPETSLHIRQVCKLSLVSSAFSADTIYVATLSTYQKLHLPYTPALFFLIRDTMENLTPDLLPKYYVLFQPEVRANRLYVELLSMIRESERVTSAKLIISQAVLDGSTVEDLLEMAAELLDNPLLMQDYTTRLLAHSRMPSEARDDEILNSVFTRGYVTADLFEKYDYEKVLSAIENTPETILVESEKKPSRLICRLMVNRQYFGWFLTVASKHSFCPGDMEIMNYLSGALTLILERENLLPGSSLVEKLLGELLEHPEEYTAESFAKRAEGFGFRLRNRYQLAGVVFAEAGGDRSRTLMAYKNHLSLLLPETKFFFRNDIMYLLHGVQESGKTEAVPENFLKKYHLRMAESNVFEGIMGLPEAYEQVNATLELARELGRTETICSFSKYVDYYAIRKLSEICDVRFLCVKGLIDVIRYDRRFGTELSHTKRVYLQAGNTAQAVKQLNIHPNTLQYRLKRFSEIAGLPGLAEDPMENYRLIRSYLILDLFPEIAEE